MYIVYGLEDQRNHEIFYVGITDDIQARFAQHLRCDGSNPLKDTRIREMVSAGYLPLPRTLRIVVDLEWANVNDLYSQGLSKEDATRRVEKYIAPHIVNAVFRSRYAAQDEVSIEQVQTLREQGHTQDEIIFMLWHVRKGGGVRYLQARERYREIVTQLAMPEVRAA
jgi:hypothetical protein